MADPSVMGECPEGFEIAGKGLGFRIDELKRTYELPAVRQDHPIQEVSGIQRCDPVFPHAGTAPGKKGQVIRVHIVGYVGNKFRVAEEFEFCTDFFC